jgi:hypothetical protein
MGGVIAQRLDKSTVDFDVDKCLNLSEQNCLNLSERYRFFATTNNSYQ